MLLRRRLCLHPDQIWPPLGGKGGNSDVSCNTLLSAEEGFESWLHYTDQK